MARMKKYIKRIKVVFLSLAIIALVFGMKRIAELEKTAQHYEERQQALISRDKALQIELADLKKYVQTGEGAGG